MPHQDYVKTARPAPRPKKKPNEKKPLPVLLIGVVTLLLIAFGAFLWHISHRPGAEAAAEQAKAAVTAPQLLDELPPKPAKEPYTYIKELQTKEIQVEADQLATKAPANMFCGTFKAMEGAQQLKAKMAFAGVSSEIRESSGKYRVVSGPYVSKRQAQNDKNKLLKQKIANCWVL
jgi:cell division protein FtsN